MGTGNYDWLTFAQAKSQLAQRLDDLGNVHWSDVENGLYIQEALTTWQALTGYWRDRGVFTLTASTPFYDVTTLLRNGGGVLILQYTTTDADLVKIIEYQLLEPPTIPWTGTNQFTLAELTDALEGTRDNFLVESGCVITHSVVNVPPAPDGRFQVDDHVIDVRRVAWLPTVPGTNLKHVPLWFSDEFAAGGYEVGWNLNPGDPESHSIIGPPPLQVQLIPVPLDKGQCDLLTVNSGAALNPAGPVVLGVPNNFSWVVKWGALADLLSQDGEPRDDFRANYCRQRYDEGCEIARLMPVILNCGLNEIQVFPQAVAELDSFRPDWAGTDSAPDSVGVAGQNIIAIAPPPDNVVPYSFRADVVRNAVVPSLDADFVQIGREYWDPILDEAFHIAIWKCGGQEFADTLPSHQAFVRSAANYNSRLKSTSIYLNAMGQQSSAENKERPRVESDTVAEATR
jgi:hypothetical protein